MTETAPRKRQARGERRIQQILDAAAEVFAEAGYESATMNAIAVRTGISPGSLYQFFRNKDEIVRRLTEVYVEELRAMHAAVFADDELAALPVEVLIDRMLGPIIKYNAERRAFKVLFARTDMPPALSEATAPLQDALLARVSGLLAARAPHRTRKEIHRAAVTASQITKALMPLITAGPMAEREAYRDQLRSVLINLLRALD